MKNHLRGHARKATQEDDILQAHVAQNGDISVPQM